MKIKLETTKKEEQFHRKLILCIQTFIMAFKQTEITEKNYKSIYVVKSNYRVIFSLVIVNSIHFANVIQIKSQLFIFNTGNSLTRING